MRNIKKIGTVICTLLIVLTVVFTGVKSVNATSQTITVNQEGVMKSFIGTEQDGFRWAKYRTDGGIVGYCLDVNKKWPESSLTMTLTGEADAGIKYILENGYPNKKIYDNGDVDRFITQGAIWWYLSDKGEGAVSEVLTKTGAEAYTGIRAKMQNLVSAAKGAKKTETNVDLVVRISGTDMSLSSDKKYYVSNEVSTTLTGANKYSVSVSGVSGAVATTTSGETKTEYTANEKFIVKVPASSVGAAATLNVKVTANGKVTKALAYKPANDEMQRVVALVTEDASASKDLTLTAKGKVNPEDVCVDYKIVGNVIPDPNLTDPTPGRNCYTKGTKYTQEKVLTTRQTNCKFNGWYTKENLTGKWTDGTALNKDMTLYGAWDCGNEVNVPSTSASTPLAVLAGGLVLVAGGFGVYYLRSKKLSINK